MCMEIVKFLRQNISIRNKVKLGTTKSLLHFDVVVAKAIFSSDFVTLREMVYSLILV